MISVVIPLYNKAHTIVSTLTTVMEQTFTNFEVVIINDGSCDSSVAVIDEHFKDNRIRIINQENAGVSAARNRGVAESRFDYIAFLDGDDEWLPDYLSKMKNAIELFPASEMFCSAGMGRNQEGATKNRQIDKYAKKVIAFDFFENPHVFLHISATVVTKKLFHRISGFTVGMKRNEDFAFLYSAALITQPIYSGFPLSIYVGGVQGQATASSIYDNQDLVNDTINRYNIVYENWKKEGAKNRSFLIFMKYELRHNLMINSINKQFEVNVYFLKNLHSEILNEFSDFEKFLFKSKRLYIIAVIYIKFTKVRWRMRGYQWVK
jgi:glycosyltransferase involved in cell wall biosynthesis